MKNDQWGVESVIQTLETLIIIGLGYHAHFMPSWELALFCAKTYRTCSVSSYTVHLQRFIVRQTLAAFYQCRCHLRHFRNMWFIQKLWEFSYNFLTEWMKLYLHSGKHLPHLRAWSQCFTEGHRSYAKQLKGQFPLEKQKWPKCDLQCFFVRGQRCWPATWLVPQGWGSWRFYSQAWGLALPIPYLKTEVAGKVLPVYWKVAHPELHSRCLQGKAQGNSESLHGVIWRRCSKDTFTSRSMVEVAMLLSVEEFNMGSTASPNFVCVRGIAVGKHTQRLGRQRDHVRQANSLCNQELKRKQCLGRLV